MTPDEMIRWSEANREAIAAFLNSHHEVAALHWVSDDGEMAYLEVTLREDGLDLRELGFQVEESFPEIDCYAFEVAVADGDDEL
jgi:hypothetical protein